MQNRIGARLRAIRVVSLFNLGLESGLRFQNGKDLARLRVVRATTHLWGYNLTGGEHTEELSRVLLENPSTVKDEGSQHDRSPLEAQREWRHEAENNVLDLLEQNGLLARGHRPEHHRQQFVDHQSSRRSDFAALPGAADD
jgi:hypothetical protein